jgi:hypothetical protein
MNLYILMPWGMVEVKDVQPAQFDVLFANVQRKDGGFAAHVDSGKFPLVFADAPPAITKTTV